MLEAWSIQVTKFYNRLAITELSVLTFSLKHNIFEDRTQDETIGRVDIVLHHLLAACTNDTRE